MRILLIDDDESLRTSFTGMFEMMGHEVVEASNGDEAASAMAAKAFDVVVCDYDLGLADTRNGVEICAELLELDGGETRFIICSGLDREVPAWAQFASKGSVQGLIDLVEEA